MNIQKPTTFKSGFTLVEVLISIVIVTMLTLAIAGSNSLTMRTIRLTKMKILAAALANEKMDELRLDYYNYNKLKVDETTRETVHKANFDFTVVRNIQIYDDPEDGGKYSKADSRTSGQADCSRSEWKSITLQFECSDQEPDTIFYDYKKVSISIESSEDGRKLIEVTSNFVSPSYETMENMGVLLINTTDENGKPISGATIEIQKQSAGGFIPYKKATSDIRPYFPVSVDIDTSGDTIYRIEVKKKGYKSDGTQPTATFNNTTQVLENTLSFKLDKYHNINVRTFKSNGQYWTGQSFILNKTSPNSQSASYTTNSDGEFTVTENTSGTYNITPPPNSACPLCANINFTSADNDITVIITEQ